MDGNDSAVTILLQLAQETRDDVKEVLKVQGEHAARLMALEQAPASAATSSKTRDAALVTGASSVVAGIIATLHALGVLK